MVAVERLVLAGHLYVWRNKVSRLEKLREYFDNWQERGYGTRPVWMDRHIESSINQLTNVELLELLDMFDEIEEQEKTK